MNVKPIPTLDERINDIRLRTARDPQRGHPAQRIEALAGRGAPGPTTSPRKEARELREDIKEG